jgi:F-type H+-transporting ATPase subunit alpha
MANIKPAEVTAILRKELAGYENVTELEEIGSVLTVGDGIARIYGLNNVGSGELIEFEKNNVIGIALNIE